MPTIKPRSSVIFDLISTWTTDPSRAHIGRLAAAAIGVCCIDPKFPRYDTGAAAPIAYGGLMIDHLLKRGGDTNQILVVGIDLLGKISEHLITQKEVDDAVNFTEPQQAET